MTDWDEREDVAIQRLADDLNAEFERRSLAGRADQIRHELPFMVAKVVEVVVDNPAQMALILAGGVVIGRAAANIVRPRTPLQALALMVVLQVGTPLLMSEAVKRGWIKFRVRDENGDLVPLVTSDDPRPHPA